MEKRYRGTGYFYPKTMLVECPKCKKEAQIVTPKGVYSDEVELQCLSCIHKESLADRILYKASVKRNCPNCGKRIEVKQDNLKKAPRDMSVTCLQCDFTAEYTPNVESYIAKNNLHKMKGDPFFNYPLWLQTSVKGKLFWSYNREHLEEIRTFVDADLRERQSSYLMTMVAKLPKFIQRAKNRKDIMRAVDLLLRK